MGFNRDGVPYAASGGGSGSPGGAAGGAGASAGDESAPKVTVGTSASVASGKDAGNYYGRSKTAQDTKTAKYKGHPGVESAARGLGVGGPVSVAVTAEIPIMSNPVLVAASGIGGPFSAIKASEHLARNKGFRDYDVKMGSLKFQRDERNNLFMSVEIGKQEKVECLSGEINKSFSEWVGLGEGPMTDGLKTLLEKAGLNPDKVIVKNYKTKVGAMASAGVGIGPDGISGEAGGSISEIELVLAAGGKDFTVKFDVGAKVAAGIAPTVSKEGSLGKQASKTISLGSFSMTVDFELASKKILDGLDESLKRKESLESLLHFVPEAARASAREGFLGLQSKLGMPNLSNMGAWFDGVGGAGDLAAGDLKTTMLDALRDQLCEEINSLNLASKSLIDRISSSSKDAAGAAAPSADLAALLMPQNAHLLRLREQLKADSSKDLHKAETRKAVVDQINTAKAAYAAQQKAIEEGLGKISEGLAGYMNHLLKVQGSDDISAFKSNKEIVAAKGALEAAKAAGRPEAELLELRKNLGSLKAVEEAARQEFDTMLGNGRAIVNTVANLASIFGDNKTAQDIAVIGGASMDAAQLGMGLAGYGTMAAMGPVGWVGVGVGIVANVVTHLRNKGKEDPQVAMMKAIQQLGQMIGQLKKEMHERFDRLEDILMKQRLEVMAEFEKLKVGVATIQAALYRIEYKIDQIREVQLYQTKILEGISSRLDYYVDSTKLEDLKKKIHEIREYLKTEAPTEEYSKLALELMALLAGFEESDFRIKDENVYEVLSQNLSFDTQVKGSKFKYVVAALNHIKIQADLKCGLTTDDSLKVVPPRVVGDTYEALLGLDKKLRSRGVDVVPEDRLEKIEHMRTSTETLRAYLELVDSKSLLKAVMAEYAKQLGFVKEKYSEKVIEAEKGIFKAHQESREPILVRDSSDELLKQFEAYEFEFKENPGWGDLTGRTKETREGGWRPLHTPHQYFPEYTAKQVAQIKAHKKKVNASTITKAKHNFDLLNLNFARVDKRLSLRFVSPEHLDLDKEKVDKEKAILPLLPVPQIILDKIPKELFIAEALGVGFVESTYSYKVDEKTKKWVFGLSIWFQPDDARLEKTYLTTFNYSLPRREYFNMAEDIWHHWFGGTYPNGTGTTSRHTYHKWDGHRGDDHYANDPIEAPFEPQQDKIEAPELQRALETEDFSRGLELINKLNQEKIASLQKKIMSTTAGGLTAEPSLIKMDAYAKLTQSIFGLLYERHNDNIAHRIAIHDLLLKNTLLAAIGSKDLEDIDEIKMKIDLAVDNASAAIALFEKEKPTVFLDDLSEIEKELTERHKTWILKKMSDAEYMAEIKKIEYQKTLDRETLKTTEQEHRGFIKKFESCKKESILEISKLVKEGEFTPKVLKHLNQMLAAYDLQLKAIQKNLDSAKEEDDTSEKKAREDAVPPATAKDETSTSSSKKHSKPRDASCFFHEHAKTASKYEDNKTELPGKEVPNEGRGNCFFLAVVDALKGKSRDAYSAKQLREMAIQYLRDNPKMLIDCPPDKSESADSYISRMSQDGVWAEGAVIDALVMVLRGLGFGMTIWTQHRDSGALGMSSYPAEKPDHPVVQLLLRYDNKGDFDHYTAILPEGESAPSLASR